MEWNREEAWKILNEYTQNPSLIKHALAVEASMRAYAAKFGENVEKWGIVGLLHDFDYEQYPTPEQHPFVGCEILKEKGYPDDMIQAILGHAEYSGVPRETLMAKTLFAVDELSGFVTAVALVRPSKSIFDVDVKSVKKKLKDKAFAKGVSREDVEKGFVEMQIEPDEHIAFVIDALKAEADSLGLRGNPTDAVS